MRERCEVMLNYGYLGYVSPRIRLEEVFAALRQLRGFREVGVVLTGAEEGIFFWEEGDSVDVWGGGEGFEGGVGEGEGLW